MKQMKRLLATLLAMAMLTQTGALAVSGITADEDGVLTITDEQGETQVVDESWEEEFPYGAFAFDVNQVNLKEGATDGAERGSFTLYRLGGTKGRAEAYITLTPAAAQLDEEGTASYANAAGKNDYKVLVEQPQPIAYYQPIGGTGENWTAATVAVTEDESLFVPDSTDDEGELVYGERSYYLPEIEAEGYQWQMLQGEFWQSLAGATEPTFRVSTELDGAYDFRCVYELAGETYCSKTLSGESYVPDYGEDIPPMPEDFVNDTQPTYEEIELTGDEYDVHFFPVVFADGEWQKTITFEALDDQFSEAAEIVALTIVEAYGAVLYDTSSTATVAIEDDEPELPSVMGFAVEELWADKSMSTVRIPLTRETEAPQFVTAADYTVAAGTASAGQDYAATDGMAVFAADMTQTYIEVDLINDGLLLEQQESDLYFTIALTAAKGGGSSTIDESRSQVTVRLFNSLTGDNKNLATDLFSPGEEDISVDIELGAPVVPASDGVEVAAVVLEEAGEAEYSPLGGQMSAPAEGEIGPLSYTYSKLSFSGIGDNSNYWSDYAIVGNNYSNNYNVGSFDADKHEGLHTTAWSGAGERYGSGGWHISTTDKYSSAGANLSISNMYARYSYANLYFLGYSDKSSNWNGKDDWMWPGYALTHAGPYRNMRTNIIDDNSHAGYPTYYNYVGATSSNDNSISIRLTYRQSGGRAGDATGNAYFIAGVLQRRVITSPYLRIHTADDTRLSQNAPSLLETIKPKVSMVAGEGGVVTPDYTNNYQSGIYANSQISVTRGDNAGSYVFATDNNGKLSNGALFLSSSSVDTKYTSTATSAVTSTSKGTLRLLPGKNAAANNVQTYVNVVFDRAQTISVEIAPSVPRKPDGREIDPSQIGDTWQKFMDEANITYNYKEASFPFNGSFSTKPGSLTAASFAAPSSGNTNYNTNNKVKNLQSINFGLPAEDLILVNGIAYRGDEDIPMPLNMFLDNTITFYYYAEEYLTAESVMVPAISRIERYIDVDDDGVVTGTFNQQTGEFTPTGSDYLLPSLVDDSYPITELAPYYFAADGKYHQLVLKVYYTMIPRCLVVPAGASVNDTAQAITAFTTNITSPVVRDKMTAEQLGYRYIDSSGTGDNKMMYTAEANRQTFVDLPLGGDHSPATVESDAVVWTPRWKGNLLAETAFEQPDPVYIDGTAIGDYVAIGEVDPANGTLTQEGREKVNHYLGSMVDNDTFALCIRETPQLSPFSDQPVHYLKGIESSRLAGFFTYPGTSGSRNLVDPSTLAGSALRSFGISPMADSSGGSHSAGFDSANANSPMSEFDIGGDINLPELSLAITDYVTIGIDGQELSITVGIPLAGYKKETDPKVQKDRPFQSGETNGIGSTNSEAVQTLKQLYHSRPGSSGNSDNTLGNAWKDAMESLQDSAKAANKLNNLGIKSAGVSAGLGVSFNILLKYDPIENKFFFNQFLLALAGNLEFTYTVRLTPLPIVYVYATVGFQVEIALGLEASRIKVAGADINLTGETSNGARFTADDVATGGETGNWSDWKGGSGSKNWLYFEEQDHMGLADLDKPEENDFLVGAPGATFKFTTKAKALDIYFSGALYVTVEYQFAGEGPATPPKGVIRSGGDEPYTLKLAEQVDGTPYKGEVWVTFTVVEAGANHVYSDTAKNALDSLPDGYCILDRIVAIERQTHDVYFSGLSFSPELFAEFGVGIGIDLLKIELFIKISVGCSFALVSHDTADYSNEKSKTNAFTFNEFSLSAGVGFRVVALFFKFEFNAVQFSITYDRETKYDEDTNKKTGWNFMWYAANQQIKDYSSDISPMSISSSDLPTVTITLPGSSRRNETIYSAEDNRTPVEDELSPLAYNPSGGDVPFQYSGYGSSGDAFPLGSDLISGENYKLVTANGVNYIAYTVTTAGDGLHTTHLALAKVVETQEPIANSSDERTVLGLSNPVTPGTTYIKVDEGDDYGDLDFDVWVDSTGNIHLAWVSYTAGATAAYDVAIASPADTVTAMAAAGKQTVVKTAMFTPTTPALSTPTIVASDTDAIYYSPRGAEQSVVYAKAVYYTDSELNARLAGYQEFLAKSDSIQSGGYYYGEGDPTINFQYTIRRMRDEVYGKSANLYITPVVSATPTLVKTLDTGYQLDNIVLDSIDGDFYVAYTVSGVSLTNGNTEEQSIKKLVLQQVEDSGAIYTPGSALVLRTMVDFTKDSTLDGSYSNGSTDGPRFKDPYFSNLKFITGKLGNLNVEDPEIFQLYSDTIPKEQFLLFEMNGNTYVVPQTQLERIVGTEHKGKILPFFEQDDAKTGADTPVVGTNLTIGADGAGNIAAVFVAPVKNTSNTAIYLTKYDPQSQTWGMGTMLAMHLMDVYEQAEANGWTVEESSAAYYDTDYNTYYQNNRLYNYTFGKLAIGMGGVDKLLVITEGTLMELEAVDAMEPTFQRDAGGVRTLTGLTQKTDENDQPVKLYQPKTDGNGYITENGIYALSFGMGQGSLGHAAISLDSYNFTSGAELGVRVSFTNTGDVAIRGSVLQPATINLMAGGQKLCSWEITSNLRAGQSVTTDKAYFTMPPTTAGDKLYFAVTEDESYTTTAFSADTCTGAGEEDTAACITIGSKIELGYESFQLSTASVEGEVVHIATDIHVGNRGGVDAENVYLRFQYERKTEDGVELYPVNLENHKLTVSEQSELKPLSLDNMSLSNGYLLLRTTQDGKEIPDQNEGQVKAMYGRTVQGTFPVRKTYYDTDYGTGSLNLRVTLLSVDAQGNQVEEFTLRNNEMSQSLEPVTFITAPDQLVMQVGSTLRIPLTLAATTTAAPQVTVTELSDTGDNNIGVLYYDTSKAALVVAPSQEGSGKIRVADLNTNSFFDICYTVAGSGTEINIFDDNGIFTWYNAAGRGGDDGRNAWNFRTALRWNDDVVAVPFRNDLAYADKNEAFSFSTIATAIDLTFMGSKRDTPVIIEVSSNLENFETVSFTSDSTTPVTIDFNNTDSLSHTVTIKALSDDVRFDTFVEFFEPDMTVKSDPAAPSIYFSRTLPAIGSVKAGDAVALTAYFVDLGGLATVLLDGREVAAVKQGDEVWSLDLQNLFTENGSHKLTAIDTSGNIATREVSVSWFNSTIPVTVDPGAPTLEAVFAKENGDAIPDNAPIGGAEDVYIKATVGGTAAALEQFNYDNLEAPKMQLFTSSGAAEPNGMFLIGAGVYRVSTVENDITAYQILNMNRIDTVLPVLNLTYSEVSGLLAYHAAKPASASTGAVSNIVSITLNGIELLPAGSSGVEFRSSIFTTYEGEYTIVVTDEAGNTATKSVTVPASELVLPAEAISITKVTETGDQPNDDGVLHINEGLLTGGKLKDVDSDGVPYGEFEYALFPVKNGAVPQPDDQTVWVAAGELNNLPAGDYVLYARDVQEPENVSDGVLLTVELLRVMFTTQVFGSFPKEDKGSIYVSATGGIGELEYSIYCLDRLTETYEVPNPAYDPDDPTNTEPPAIDVPMLCVDDNGTPLDDTDDIIVEFDRLNRPRWQKEADLTGLNPGTYLVCVRDKDNPNNYVEAEVVVPTLYSSVTHAITATAGEGGSIAPAGKIIYDRGQKATYVITPDKGYRIADVLVDGESVGAVSSYLFEKVQKSHTIEAVFTPDIWSNPFVDVTQDDWFYDAVGYVHGNGLFLGTGDTTFSPHATTTRGMLVTVLQRMNRLPVQPGQWSSFPDVAADMWYAEGVHWASVNGLVKGYDTGLFGPEDNVTREQIAVVLFNYYKALGYVSQSKENALAAFADEAAVSDWAAEAMAWMVSAGLMEGRGANTLAPTAHATRAELAALLERFNRFIAQPEA